MRDTGASLAFSLALAACGCVGAQSLASDSPLPATPMAASQAQSAAVTTALAAAKAGDGARVQAIIASAADPLVRKIALWALADGAPDTMTWTQADEARRDLADWPRAARRQMAAEKLIDQSALPPKAVIAWFGGAEPLTAQGAMSLASALRADGQLSAAAGVIRRAWRSLGCDQAAQGAMLARFNDMLTPADIEARVDLLLYGSQGPAVLDLIPLIPADRQAVAQARLALRRGDPQAETLVAALPVADQTNPGLIYERMLDLQARGDTATALALVNWLPQSIPSEAAAEKLWRHGRLVVEALQAGDAQHAYAAAAHAGVNSGLPAAEAQFYAGWIALTRLKDLKRAEDHFARLQALSESPITQARALYWRGRTAEAAGDLVEAQLFYGQAARNQTTFYGQLAATRGGKADLVLGHDPQITAADRAAFESRDTVKAARLLASLGAHDTFRTFVSALSETLPDTVSEAQLVDLASSDADQSLAMRVVRNGAKRGLILPERGYPVRTPPAGVAFAAETPLVLGITRQESSFDPTARSGAGARGMMQLLPATAQTVARRNGLGRGSLDDPDFNMKVGSAFLGQLVDQFSGSYVLATAAYNAGPGRPTQWTSLCGDPRNSSSDPLDFIECIPFSETKDYVMRVMEATQVYRARLNGGAAPITLEADLKRGAYGYHLTPYTPTQATTPPAPVRELPETTHVASSAGR